MAIPTPFAALKRCSDQASKRFNVYIRDVAHVREWFRGPNECRSSGWQPIRAADDSLIVSLCSRSVTVVNPRNRTFS